MILLALVHFAVLSVLAQYGMLFAYDLGLNVALCCLYGALAAAAGYAQMRNYAGYGYWMFFTNRPLKSTRLLTGLAMAIGLAISIIVVAPWLFFIIAFEFSATNVSESRQYLLPLFLFGVSFNFYLAGVLVAIAPNRLYTFLLWIP